MPYIRPERRKELSLEPYGVYPQICGELNFEFTRAIDNYVNTKGLSYQTLNDVVGALECAKMELYRRIAVPYENIKIEENGDVYTCVE